MEINKEHDRLSTHDILTDVASFGAAVGNLSSLTTEELHGLREIGRELRIRAIASRERKATGYLTRRLMHIEHELIKRTLQATRYSAEPKRIVLPPRFFFDGLLRRFMSLGQYDRYIKPHVADMHEEYFTYLARKDERGARWAVIRCHLYVIPSWVWAVLGRLLARVLGRVI